MENGFKQTLQILNSKNYRLFIIGQSISLTGTWMQGIAMSWLVYRLTNSAFLLGLVGFTSQIPAFMFAPFAGVLADKWNKRKILIVTQSLAMLQAIILAILVLTKSITVWQIILLGIFLGLVGSFDIPTRQSFIMEIIEKKEHIGNAIALNSTMFNITRLIGPSIAGVLIASIGEGWCFFINGISYISAITVLFLIKVVPQNKEDKNIRILDEFKQGFSYTYGFSPIRSILLLLGTVSLLVVFHGVLAPVVAKDILHGGPTTLGLLMASSGVGALLGSIYLASRRSVLGLGKIIPLATIILGLGIIGFALSKTLVLSLILMLIIGFGMIIQMASSNTVIQTIVDDDKRGRVMSFFVISFIGTAPLGSLLSGSLAGIIGVSNTILISGICCIIAAQLFLRKLPEFREKIKPIYVRKGIITETIPVLSR